MMYTTLKSALIVFLLMEIVCTRTIRLGSHRWVGNSRKPFIRLARNEQAIGRQMNDDGSDFGYTNGDANHQIMTLESSHHQLSEENPISHGLWAHLQRTTTILRMQFGDCLRIGHFLTEHQINIILG